MKIPIKKYKDDESLSWEQRYENLMKHHEEETKWLLSQIESLEENLDYLRIELYDRPMPNNLL
jgi:hypothetical protein